MATALQHGPLLVLLVIMTVMTSSNAAPSDLRRLIERKLHRDQVQPSKVVCYFPNWAQNSTYGQGTFTVPDIDPSICNYVKYAFGYIVGTKLVPTEAYDFFSYQQLYVHLKVTHAQFNVKTILSVGGYEMGPLPFEYIVENPGRMRAFANNAIKYLRTHRFDGMDIDWEYPNPHNRDKHVELLKTIKEQFEREHLEEGQEKLILTIAMAGDIGRITNNYNVQELRHHISYANIMTYDFYGYWGETGQFRTGHHAALYGNPSQDIAVTFLVDAGMSRNQIVLGMPTFGRSFTLCDENQNQPGDMACGKGHAGVSTKEAGALAYFEICQKIHYDGWTEEYDSEAVGVFAHKGDQWVSYDNELSMTTKIQYIKDQGLLGVMFWDLSKDEFNNQCQGGDTYPLIRKAQVFIEPPSPTLPPTLPPTPGPTPGPTTSPSPPPASTTIPPYITCGSGETYIRDRYDCAVYYHCHLTTAYRFVCPAGLFFDLTLTVCNYRGLVDCDEP